MKHLSSIELVDFVEGTLSQSRASHAQVCERCRREADELQATLAEAREIEVPEPSPLFWDHLSSRVRAAVAAEPRSPRLNAWAWRPAYGLVAALVVVVLIVTATWRPGRERTWGPASSAIEPARGTAAIEPLGGFDAEPADDTWEMVVAMSSGLAWDEAEEAGFGVPPGTADRVLTTLTAGEQLELARILRTEFALTESM